MRRKRHTKTLKHLLWTVVAFFCWSQPVCAATFAPPEGKTLLFIGQDKKNIADYVRATGMVPAGTMVYTSLENLEGLVRAKDQGGGIQHAEWLAERFPHSALQIGLYLGDTLNGVVLGQFDKNLKKLARWLRRLNRPVYLRIGYEFDNPENHYASTQYQEAFRRIVRVLRAEGVKNVAFVWHAQAAHPDTNYMFWYPGDKFVDWVAVSFFSPYNTDNMDKVLRIARSHGKPFMLAESSAIKMDTFKREEAFERWFQLAREYIRSHKVEAFCYINVDWDKLPMHAHLHWGDARVQSDPKVLKKWTRMISQDSFLNASAQLFGVIGFTPKPDKVRNRYF